MLRLRPLIALVAAPTLLGPGFASAAEFQLDAVHSALLFRVKHLELNQFYGRFNDLDGRLQFDPRQPEKASVTVTVQAGSIDTNSKGRDGHLKGAAALAAEAHPAIRFASTRVVPAGPGQFKVHGTLSFRGVDRPIVADARLTGSSVDDKDPGQRDGKVGFEIAFAIKRSDFGMTGMNMVADEVQLLGGLEWNRIPARAKPDEE